MLLSVRAGMNRGSLSFVCLAGFACPLTLPVPAFAAPQEKFRIHYSAPSDCPTQAQFESRVSLRVSVPWLASDGEMALPLLIYVGPSGGAWEASLRLDDPGGQILSRSVSANTCEAAVEAIALATALLLDPASAPSNPKPAMPTANLAPHNGQVSSAALPFEGDAGANASAPQTPVLSVPHRPKQAFEATPAGRAAAMPAPGPARQSDPRGKPQREVGMSLGFLTGLGPGVAYAASVFGGFWSNSTQSRLGVAAYQTGFAATDVAGVRLRVRLLAAKGEHCPLALPVVREVRFFACAGAETGILLTNGRADAGVGVDAKQGHAWWLMAGVKPKFGYRQSRVFAELEFDVFVPITRREFAVAPSNGTSSGSLELAHRTPQLALGGFSSVGLLF